MANVPSEVSTFVPLSHGRQPTLLFSKHLFTLMFALHCKVQFSNWTNNKYSTSWREASYASFIHNTHSATCVCASLFWVRCVCVSVLGETGWSECWFGVCGFKGVPHPTTHSSTSEYPALVTPPRGRVFVWAQHSVLDHISHLWRTHPLPPSHVPPSVARLYISLHLRLPLVCTLF